MPSVVATRSAAPASRRCKCTCWDEIDYGLCLALQQRLVYETSGRDRRPDLAADLRARGTDLGGPPGLARHIRHEPARRWKAIGWQCTGSIAAAAACCTLPGQLAVYPIVPLDWHGWTVGEYHGAAARRHRGVPRGVGHRGATPDPAGTASGAARGQLAMLGVAVKGWTAYHGAYPQRLARHAPDAAGAERSLGRIPPPVAWWPNGGSRLK